MLSPSHMLQMFNHFFYGVIFACKVILWCIYHRLYTYSLIQHFIIILKILRCEILCSAQQVLIAKHTKKSRTLRLLELNRAFKSFQLYSSRIVSGGGGYRIIFLSQLKWCHGKQWLLSNIKIAITSPYN